MRQANIVALAIFLPSFCVGNKYLEEARLNIRFDQLQGGAETALTVLYKTALAFPHGVRQHIVTDVNSAGHRLAVIVREKHTGEITRCDLFGHRTIIKDIVKNVAWNRVMHVRKETMDDIIDQCMHLKTTIRESFPVRGWQARNIIFPGTKWCGAGHVAKHYYDLGSARETDKCCRAHDHSKYSIKAFGFKCGIWNYRPYTMTACVDDRKFLKCLLKVGSVTAKLVGVIYFDLLNTKCFECDHSLECARVRPGSVAWLPQEEFRQRTLNKCRVVSPGKF